MKGINDLVDIEGSIKNWVTIGKEFNLNPVHFLERYGVCSSIPNESKRTVKGYLSNSSDSSVLTCNVLSGIEVDGKFVSVEKFLPKRFIKCWLNISSQSPLHKNFSQKSSTLVIRTFGARFIYFLPGGINRIKDKDVSIQDIE